MINKECGLVHTAPATCKVPTTHLSHNSLVIILIAFIKLNSMKETQGG